eukprot:g72476.t1
MAFPMKKPKLLVAAKFFLTSKYFPFSRTVFLYIPAVSNFQHCYKFIVRSVVLVLKLVCTRLGCSVQHCVSRRPHTREKWVGREIMCISWCNRLRVRWEIESGCWTLDPWEKFFTNSFFLLVISIVSYWLYTILAPVLSPLLFICCRRAYIYASPHLSLYLTPAITDWLDGLLQSTVT